MDSIDITNFFSFSEDEKTGDFRCFYIYCPYIEGGEQAQFHHEWRITGTEEEMIGETGIEETRRKNTAVFERRLIANAKRDGKRFEIHDQQLWLCADET